MPDKANKTIQTVVSEETYKQLQEIAEGEGMKISDFVRATLQRRCEELGVKIDFDIKSWGGKRPGSGRKP